MGAELCEAQVTVASVREDVSCVSAALQRGKHSVHAQKNPSLSQARPHGLFPALPHSRPRPPRPGPAPVATETGRGRGSGGGGGGSRAGGRERHGQEQGAQRGDGRAAAGVQRGKADSEHAQRACCPGLHPAGRGGARSMHRVRLRLARTHSRHTAQWPRACTESPSAHCVGPRGT